MIYIHWANLTAGLVQNVPMAALVGSFSYLNYCYFLTKSSKLVIVNNMVTLGEFFLYMRKIREIYKVTLTEEQGAQVSAFILVIIFVLMISSVFNFYQKNIEINLWRLLNENYKRSENLTKEVVQAMNAKDNFVSSLSHEVRTVLCSLNDSVDNLLTVLSDHSHLKILKNAKMSGEILFNLVSNALDAIKIRADKLELFYSHNNLQDILKKVFIINSGSLQSKNIKAKAFIDQQVPKNLWIDSGRLLQILMNLMSNAIKFTPKEGQINIHVLWCKEKPDSNSLLDSIQDTETHNSSMTRQNFDIPNKSLQDDEGEDESVLEFSMDEEKTRNDNLSKLTSFPSENKKAQKSSNLICHNDTWQILDSSSLTRNPPENTSDESPWFLKVQISDTGCGIVKDRLPTIFDMYTYDISSSNPEGTGLGLWVCKQLCQKMQGDIAVYSQVDRGTKFVFYVPVEKLHHDGEEANVHRKVRALVVDDLDFNRDLHKLLLEREGVQVTLAHNGKEAVHKYKQRGEEEEYFDFIFMDLNMPVMDGFTATKEIRRWEVQNHRKRIKIYIVSSEYFNDHEVVEVLKNTGGLKDITDIKFLRKPIEVEMVTKIVKHHRESHNHRL